MSSIRTLNDIHFHALEAFDTRRAFLRKVDGRYREVSRKEFGDAVAELSLGLVALGLERGDRGAILSENRLEWAMADIALLTAAMVTVPVYATVTASAVEYIVRDSGTRVLFASTADQAAKAREALTDHPDCRLVVFDEDARVEGALTLAEVRERGRALRVSEPDLHRQRAGRVEPDDLATIIYTSGTTGPPKGVMLSHHNLVSNIEAALSLVDIGPGDTALSFLPLSHVLERMAGYYTMIRAGATIAYAESVETVAENLLEVRPTVMISVPRLYEKIYARVLDAAMARPTKRKLFLWARRLGTERARLLLAGRPVPVGLRMRFAVADRLVFAKLRARTGGRMRFFISGGAPLSKEIAEFFYAAGLIILEGYGLTETSPLISVNTPDAIKLGTVGRPAPGVEVRIADDGEILCRGPNVMLGYYNRPEDTAEVIKDGWLHTGDVGYIDEDGFLVITDRKKDIIVTAGGKNVAPQPIENALKTDKFLQEVVVIGDRRPYLVALVVPAFENLEAWARLEGIEFRDRSDLVAHPRVREFLQERIEHHQRDQASFETIKKIHVLDRELTIEQGELTPTLKVKRKKVAELYEKEIERLYAEGQETPR